MAESDSVSGEIAPRSAHTGQNSLFSLNAVPQTSQARLPFVSLQARLATRSLADLVADRLHKMVCGRGLRRAGASDCSGRVLESY
jgi:hypothetical protein